MMHQTITDFEIQALVDDQLGWEEQKRVRAYIESAPEARKRYEELCTQKRLLQQWWASGGFAQ